MWYMIMLWWQNLGLYVISNLNEIRIFGPDLDPFLSKFILGSIGTMCFMISKIHFMEMTKIPTLKFSSLVFRTGHIENQSWQPFKIKIKAYDDIYMLVYLKYLLFNLCKYIYVKKTYAYVYVYVGLLFTYNNSKWYNILWNI